MMSEQTTEALREMQRRLEADAATVTTYADLRRLRAYWNDIEQAIRLDSEPSTE